MKTFTDQSRGIKINRHIYEPHSPGCPAWAKRFESEIWAKQGVIVWDEATQRIERLSAAKTLTLFERLKTERKWKKAGILITQIFAHLPISEELPSRRKNTKATSPEPVTPIEEPKAQWVEDERFRLTAAASLEFFDLIAANESQLRELAKEEREQESQLLSRVYGMLIKAGCRQELVDFDLSSRSLPWTRDEDKCQLQCDLPPNRGTVALDAGGWFWQGCIERPHCFKHHSPRTLDLEEALMWVEQELQQPYRAGATADEDIPPISPKQLKALRPHWIKPAQLEPDQTSWRIVVEVETQPVHFKTMEMSFGELFQYEKEYLTPTQLARQINLDATRLDIEQLLGPAAGWYRLNSLVIYLRESLAVSQAQLLWDQSWIADQYKNGKIIRARYGVQEVETGYTQILGVCDQPDGFWLTRQTRASYLKRKALKETIVQAGDLAAFRSFLRLSPNIAEDEKLLGWLHEHRFQSRFTSLAHRKVSEKWLRNHPQK